MKRILSEFNSEGVGAFSDLIQTERDKGSSTKASIVGEEFLSDVQRILDNPQFSKELPQGELIDCTKTFNNRYEFGAYLHKQLPDDGEVIQQSNVGLWAWISAIFMRQLLKKYARGNGYELWSLYRYVPLEYSKFRYYRHLAFISFWMHRRLNDNAARFFLTRPMYEHSDFIEQMYTADKNFLTTPSLIEIALEMYMLDGDLGQKPKAAGRNTPGSAIRLAQKVAPQLQMNYDLYSMSKEEIYDLLPAEFDKWRR